MKLDRVNIVQIKFNSYGLETEALLSEAWARYYLATEENTNSPVYKEAYSYTIEVDYSRRKEEEIHTRWGKLGRKCYKEGCQQPAHTDYFCYNHAVKYIEEHACTSPYCTKKRQRGYIYCPVHLHGGVESLQEDIATLKKHLDAQEYSY